MSDYDAQPGRRPPARPALSRAQLEADDVDLREGLAGIAGIVAGACKVSEMLRDMAEFARRAIPGAEGAAVALVQPSGGSPRVQMRAATAVFVDEIDTVQYEDLGEGPCITCMGSRRPTLSGSLGCDSRWPRFGGRVSRMGMHSVLALPLLVDERVIGTVTAYAHDRDTFADHAVELGAQFAAPAAVSLYNAQLLATARERTEQLQRALASRAVIDQAIGIIRSRSGIGAEEAFDRLKESSQHQNEKLHLVAEQLVEEAERRARARRGERG